MNKLLVLAVIVAVVSADCASYSNNVCGNGTEDCSNWVKSNNACANCAAFSTADQVCGDKNVGGLCFAYAKDSADATKCKLDCTIPNAKACSTHKDCADYKYDESTSKCAVSSAGKIAFVAALLLAFFF